MNKMFGRSDGIEIWPTATAADVVADDKRNSRRDADMATVIV